MLSKELLQMMPLRSTWTFCKNATLRGLVPDKGRDCDLDLIQGRQLKVPVFETFPNPLTLPFSIIWHSYWWLECPKRLCSKSKELLTSACGSWGWRVMATGLTLIGFSFMTIKFPLKNTSNSLRPLQNIAKSVGFDGLTTLDTLAFTKAPPAMRFFFREGMYRLFLNSMRPFSLSLNAVTPTEWTSRVWFPPANVSRLVGSVFWMRVLATKCLVVLNMWCKAPVSLRPQSPLTIGAVAALLEQKHSALRTVVCVWWLWVDVCRIAFVSSLIVAGLAWFPVVVVVVLGRFEVHDLSTFQRRWAHTSSYL